VNAESEVTNVSSLFVSSRVDFSLVSDARATTTTARFAFDGTNFYTQRERERFFFFFFCGRNGPFREIPSRREEILEALFLAAEIVVIKRCKNKGKKNTTEKFFLDDDDDDACIF